MATWARDVADIFSRLVHRIEALLASPDNETLREWFDAFHEELKVSINASISRDNAIEMMAQHTLTRPVFEALFEHYDFAAGNPVAQALDSWGGISESSVSRTKPEIWSASTKASACAPAASTTAKRGSTC